MKKSSKISIRLAVLLWVALCPFLQTAYAQKGDPVNGEREGCCAYSLNFVNTYEEGFLKKIRVSATCETAICCADPDEWAQSGEIPKYIDWYPADSSAIPLGNAIDNDFMIYLDGPNDPQTLQVEWLDFNDVVICRQIITISCNRDYKEDEDWTLYTTRTSPDDPNLFVFAVREPDDDGEEEDAEFCNAAQKQSDCTFDTSINCSGLNTYMVSLTGPDPYTIFDWHVSSGPATPGISSGKNTSVDLTTPGVYVVALMAIDPANDDTCQTSMEIFIPDFNPSFTTKFFPCTFKVEFTAHGAFDPSTLSQVQWSCAGHPSFPATGNTVTYDFQAPGTYNVSMTLIDKYGCAHSVVQTVTLPVTCKAEFEVDHYVLCPDCTGPADIDVYFNNLSTGGTCPINYKWDFGDGQTGTSNHTNTQVIHKYHVKDCRTKSSYTVKLTMIDSSTPTPCTTYASIQLIIEPCDADFAITICPDGKVILTPNNNGTWQLPPQFELAPWPVSSAEDDKGRRGEVVGRLPEGTFSVTFKSHCTTGGECTKTKSFTVKHECCAKNDADRSDTTFTASGKDYKMKYNLVQRQLPAFHRIKAKTKLKVRKKILGIKYWKGTKADVIEASHNGTIYKSDAVCNCTVPETTSRTEINTNSSKAKYWEPIGGKYRSRKNTLISTHRVEKSGTTIIKNLDLGNDCDKFRWLTNWF